MAEETDGHGERKLACAVLDAALADLRSQGYVAKLSERRTEAQLFCIAVEGGWARARRFWCDLAGIEEVCFTDAAQRIMNTTVVVA